MLGHYRSYQVLGTILTPGPGQEPIERGLRAAMREELERVFRLLDLLHPRRDFRAAWIGLQSGNTVIHDQALDLLESLLRPETKALLVPLVDPEIPEPQRVRLAHRLVGAPVDTPEQGIDALASTGDPWLRSCAAYAIGSLGLVTLAHHPRRGATTPTRCCARPRARRARSAQPRQTPEGLDGARPRSILWPSLTIRLINLSRQASCASPQRAGRRAPRPRGHAAGAARRRHAAVRRARLRRGPDRSGGRRGRRGSRR